MSRIVPVQRVRVPGSVTAFRSLPPGVVVQVPALSQVLRPRVAEERLIDRAGRPREEAVLVVVWVPGYGRGGEGGRGEQEHEGDEERGVVEERG